ncbi:MAG: hypothetical protein ACRC9X_02170 [Bacteroidales bacterium]
MLKRFTCQHCQSANVRLSACWFIDVGVAVYCNSCKARLAHVNFVLTAVLCATSITAVYFAIQDSCTNWFQVKMMIGVCVLPTFAFVNVVRVGLLFFLLWLKQADRSSIFR